LPDDPLQAIVDELQGLGIAAGRWCGYLQQLAMELPGWAGMFHWRESRPQAAGPPVSLVDLLAVRLILDRLYGAQLLRRVWGLPMQLEALGKHFLAHPQELQLRHAYGSRNLPEEMLASIRPLLLAPVAGSSHGWTQLAAAMPASAATVAAGEQAASAAWPLFVLAQRLGISGRALHELAADGAQALLACAASLSDAERGQVWLLAYERHYRQQILAALAANRGRSPARLPQAAAQFVFCMDDREEGTRRHLEEVNPAYETFGAAGFFGVPMLWLGLDDDKPTALCPVVVRPTNAVRETVPAAAEVAHRQHVRRRRLRLRWQERVHQKSRRGSVLAALLTAVAAPAALLALLARTLAPGRLGGLLERCREAFDKPLRGTLQLTADGDEAHRPARRERHRAASAESPRQGFSEDEQVARVAGFLRSIGLTEGFAPFLVIVGHGSDSRNNPHLAAYDCGACSGRHGGPNARVLAALANRPQVRRRLAEQGIVIADSCRLLALRHAASSPSNTTPATRASCGTRTRRSRPGSRTPSPACAATARRPPGCTRSNAAAASPRPRTARRRSRRGSIWRTAARIWRKRARSWVTRPSRQPSSAAAA